MLNSESSRRDFLKTSGALSLGAMAFNSLSNRAFAAGDDTIRVGLVGCGGRGSGAATQALSTEGKVKLVAVGDAFADQIESSLNGIKGALKDRADRVEVDDDHKFVGFDAYQQVINSDVDLVILATPPASARFISKPPLPPASTSSWRNRSRLTLQEFARCWLPRKKRKRKI